MTLFFGIIMGIGLLYLLSVILGGMTDFFNLDGTLESMGLGGLLGIEGATDALDGVDDVGSVMDALDGADGMDVDMGADASDASGDVQGIGCLTISAFLAMFGAIGLVGSLSERSLWLILLIGVIISYAVARIVAELLKYVYRQQDNTAFSQRDLIGKTARATINAAPGTTGEVMVEMGGMLRYPVKEINGSALNRGDEVRIIDVDGRTLKVEKLLEVQ